MTDEHDDTSVVLDAGAFIAYERGDPGLRAVVEFARRGEVVLATSTGVVAQVWREGSRSAVLHRLFASGVIEEEPLDGIDARLVGRRCGATGAADVVDAHVCVIAERTDADVITSDPGDLVALGLAADRVIAV